MTFEPIEGGRFFIHVDQIYVDFSHDEQKLSPVRTSRSCSCETPSRISCISARSPSSPHTNSPVMAAIILNPVIHNHITNFSLQSRNVLWPQTAKLNLAWFIQKHHPCFLGTRGADACCLKTRFLTARGWEKMGSHRI